MSRLKYRFVSQAAPRGALVWTLLSVFVLGSDAGTTPPSFTTTPQDVDARFASSHPSGPIADAKCDVEAVEHANAFQLSLQLQDVLQTSFFRHFMVNLDGECRFWAKPEADGAVEEEEGEEGAGCAATSAAVGLDEPACSVQPADAFASPFAPPGGGGGGGGSEPLLPWGPSTDPIDSPEEPPDQSAECEDPKRGEFWLNICSHFTNQTESTGAKLVDLTLNPERWTGYDGSHIWAAIYSENCFLRSGSESDMCFEERVLYKLLSGMHSSVNIHIAKQFFPPSKKHNRRDWAPNPAEFEKHFAGHPERLENVHFAFVVLLRALHKASPVLYKYPYYTQSEGLSAADGEEAERTTKLVRRLLDTHILQSCSDVFSAFDESLLFGDIENPSPVTTLKTSFKGVFQNISAVLDCVTCQKCKLHGKVTLLGLGAALKVLLTPEELLLRTADVLAPMEIVALVNTVGKFSQSITAIEQFHASMGRHWESSYFGDQKVEEGSGGAPEGGSSGGAEEARAAAEGGGGGGGGGSGSIPEPAPDALQDWMRQEVAKELAGLGGGLGPSFALRDAAVGAVAAARAGATAAEEDALVDRALEADPELLLLARHYRDLPEAFLRHARRRRLATPPAQVGLAEERSRNATDVIIVGGGLAGLTAAITLADRGAHVTVVEKNAFFGGNSAYASSGLNAVDPNATAADGGDTLEAYTRDTLGSSPSPAAALLAPVLTGGSFKALTWIRERVGVDLNQKSQLGGHSHARTFRPSSGMAGSEIMFALGRLVKGLEAAGRVRTLLKHRAQRLMLEGGRLAGLEVRGPDGAASTVQAPHLVMATGGYAGEAESEDALLRAVRPDLAHLASTNGPFATGEGVLIAAQAGAATLEMDHVQVHPTAFVDPRRPDSKRKTLCAELLRGVGALLLDRAGLRLGNELGKRDYLVAQMTAAQARTQADDPSAFIVLFGAAAAVADKHVPHYAKKGLLHQVPDAPALAAWMRAQGGGGPADTAAVEAAVASTLAAYASHDPSQPDEFGKKEFPNHRLFAQGPYYVGMVTPALHYTMGGLSINAQGQVLREGSEEALPGLWAAGEAMGGVHGTNRLAGNALTECVVFGQTVGEAIPLQHDSAPAPAAEGRAGGGGTGAGAGAGAGSLRGISAAELGQHRSEQSAWVAINGLVYDLTEFLEEHPAGPESILDTAGVDGTEVFLSVHTLPLLEEDFTPIGRLVD